MAVQLFIAFVVACPFVFIASFESYLHDEQTICYAVVPIVIVVAVLLQFIPGVIEETPQLIVATAGLTIGEGVCFGILAATFDLNALLLLPSVAAAVTFLLSVYSLQRCMNYTIFVGFLVCVCMSIVGTVVMFVFADFRDDISTVACGIAAGFISLYFAYDIQRLAYERRCELVDLIDFAGIPLTAYFDIVHLSISLFDDLTAGQ